MGLAGELRRRCLVNKETATDVADDLGLDREQCRGAVRLLRAVNVSRERLACVVMLDPGLEDEDVAEMFDLPVEWAVGVRRQMDRLRLEEPIPEHLEYIDDGLVRGDPSPREILERAAELRALRDAGEPVTRNRIKPLCEHILHPERTPIQLRFAWRA